MNPHSLQALVILLDRLLDASLPDDFMNEQYRLVGKLSELPSSFWYHGRIQQPRIFLNVANGVCVKMPSMSRQNLDNVAATVAFLRSFVLKVDIDTSRIAILTLYKAQGPVYRQALADCMNDPELRRRHINRVAVFTANSTIGGQFEVTIVDFVTSFCRGTSKDGGLCSVGHTGDRRVLNVALTRVRNLQVIVFDSRAHEDITGRSERHRTKHQQGVGTPEDPSANSDASSSGSEDDGPFLANNILGA